MCDQLTSYYARDRKSKRYDTFTINPTSSQWGHEVYNNNRGTLNILCGAGLLNFLMGTTHLYY